MFAMHIHHPMGMQLNIYTREFCFISAEKWNIDVYSNYSLQKKKSPNKTRNTYNSYSQH